MTDHELSREQALDSAKSFLGDRPDGSEYKLVIMDEYTVERKRCFVFFYESSRFLETGAFEDRLAGNAPIFVDRQTGKSQFLGTAHPVEYYIDRLEQA